MDAELEDLVTAGIVELYVNEDGEDAVRLTPMGEEWVAQRVARTMNERMAQRLDRILGGMTLEEWAAYTGRVQSGPPGPTDPHSLGFFAGLDVRPEVRVPRLLGERSYDDVLVAGWERAEADTARKFRYQCTASPKCAWRGSTEAKADKHKSRRVLGNDVLEVNPKGHTVWSRETLDRKVRRYVTERLELADEAARDAYRRDERRLRRSDT